jgi:osmoprotectant transport system substrate-binding protein
VVLAGTAECPERPKCEVGCGETYGIDITEDLPLGFGSVQNKEAVDLRSGPAGAVRHHDGTLGPSGLVVLEDDKRCRTPTTWCRSSTPTARPAPTRCRGPERPERGADHGGPGELNRRVDEDREQAADVARSYLEEKGLLEA